MSGMEITKELIAGLDELKDTPDAAAQALVMTDICKVVLLERIADALEKSNAT